MQTEPSAFHFKAGDREGGVFTGRLSAPSAEHALAQLQQKGFVPLRLAEKPLREPWYQREIALGSRKQLSRSDAEAFCQELGLLLGSGVVVADAIAIMLPSLKKGAALRAFATAVRHGLRLGRPLSHAVESAGFRLPSDLAPVIGAGEEAGSLPSALKMLATSYADGNRFARVYLAALAYPVLLLCVSAVVLALIAFFVAPSLAGLFVSMEKPAPFAISALTGLATFLSSNAVALALGTVVLVATAMVTASADSVRQALRTAVLRLPVVGSAMRWSASGRFAATLELCLANGVSISTALPNALISAGYGRSARTQRLIDEVRAGARLSASLEQAGIMPLKLVHLIQVGESSGRLVEVLAAIVTEARNRFEQRMSLLTALLAPGLILVVGSLIGTVIFSVFSALLDINEIAF